MYLFGLSANTFESDGISFIQCLGISIIRSPSSQNIFKSAFTDDDLPVPLSPNNNTLFAALPLTNAFVLHLFLILYADKRIKSNIICIRYSDKFAVISKRIILSQNSAAELSVMLDKQIKKLLC